MTQFGDRQWRVIGPDFEAEICETHDGLIWSADLPLSEMRDKRFESLCTAATRNGWAIEPVTGQ